MLTIQINQFLLFLLFRVLRYVFVNNNNLKLSRMKTKF